MVEKVLYRLLEDADKLLVRGENVPQELINNIKKYTAGGSYVGLAQINTMSGNLQYNSNKISNYIKYASNICLDKIIFPELSLVGFPLEDTVYRHPSLAKECIKYLKEIAKITTSTNVVLGFVEPIDGDENLFYNSIAILFNGEIQGLVRKSLFVSKPITKDNYYFEKYYDNRILAPENLCKKNIIDNFEIKYSFDNSSFLIGDDLFIESSKDNDVLKFDESNYIVNSIFAPSFDTQNMISYNKVSNSAKKLGLPIIQVNSVGANDGFSFDGLSTVYNNDGSILARAKAFEEQLLVAEIDQKIGKVYDMPLGYVSVPEKKSAFSLDYSLEMERLYKTLVQGIRDYFKKCGLSRAVLGLSGGLDSTISAVLCADAIGKENVLGISMPSHITTKESKNDAEVLAKNLGINFLEYSIKPMIDVTTSCTNDIFNNVSKTWGKYWDKENACFSNSISNTPVSFTPDNIQARSRAMYLWSVSNEFSSCIPIATSDKSELYMGYATINGDMSGGFAPIADVTKTKLFALARWMNENRNEKNAIPESIILKRPGAELAIDPKTGKPLIAEDALMPYEFLDEIIWRVENKKQSYDDLLEVTFVYEKEHDISIEQKKEWLKKFYKRMSFALYKWSILPPSIILERNTINKGIYKQPVTSSKIAYYEK